MTAKEQKQQKKLRQIFDLLAFTRDVIISQVPDSAGQAVHKNFHIIAVKIEEILR